MKKFTFLLFVIFGSINLCAQDPGDFYTDFGTDGIITEDWPDTVTASLDIVLLPDHNLAVSYMFEDMINDVQKIGLAKLDATGEIMDFGNTRKGFNHDFSEFELTASAYPLPDGKILMAGTYGALMNVYPFLLRLNSDGQLDETFSDDGIYTDLVNNFYVNCMDVYFDGDSYMIVIAGLNAVYNMIIMAFDENGNKISTFGESGEVNLGYVDGRISDLEIIQEDGDLFACSQIDGGGTKIMKLNLSDGSYDTDFGTDGVLSFTSAEDFFGNGEAILYKAENNTLTIFGTYPHPTGGDADIFAYRVNAVDGTPDDAFGIAGWATLRSATSTDEIHTAILQSDGKYYFAGVSDFLGTMDFFIGRINDNGSPDAAFGTNGLLLIDKPADEYISELTLSADESILYAAGNVSGMDGAIMLTAHYTGYFHEVPVSISENEDDPLIVYPNPVKGPLHIATGLSGRHHYKVCNLTGALVVSGSFDDGCFDIDLSSWPASAYFLSVTLPDSRSRTFKILKQD